MPTPDKLAIFDSIWTRVDEKYACFENLTIDWHGLRTKYRPEIELGVSRGRFAAIMNHLSVQLRESHTVFLDSLVNVETPALPGMPLIHVGGWGENGRFGAGLTPLPDSSLLVYQAVPNHPLGLEPGDVVLGYEGIPWKRIYRVLLREEIPIGIRRWTNQGVFAWGSNPTAFEHSWLMSAGLNWHLFDSIDILDFETGDTLHLSTYPLSQVEMSISTTEQLPVPGIEMPDRAKEIAITWGVVDGTRVGYVYVWSWFWGSPAGAFDNAIDSLAMCSMSMA